MSLLVFVSHDFELGRPWLAGVDRQSRMGLIFHIYCVLIAVDMSKGVLQFLQAASAVTLSMLRELTIHPLVANFTECVSAKNYEYQLTVDKVIAVVESGNFSNHVV